MKDLMTLKENYSKLFGSWFTESEIKAKLYDFISGKEIAFETESGIKTYDPNEAKLSEYADGVYTCKGYVDIELPYYSRGYKAEVITVYLNCYFSDYDEEEKTYNEQSDEVIGWD